MIKMIIYQPRAPVREEISERQLEAVSRVQDSDISWVSKSNRRIIVISSLSSSTYVGTRKILCKEATDMQWSFHTGHLLPASERRWLRDTAACSHTCFKQAGKGKPLFPIHTDRDAVQHQVQSVGRFRFWPIMTALLKLVSEVQTTEI